MRKEQIVSICAIITVLVMLFILFCISFVSAYSWNSSFDNGLVVYYPLDNNIDVINGVNLTLRNFTLNIFNSSQCLSNGCAHVNGTNFLIGNQTGNWINFSESFTFNVWLRQHTISGSQYWFGKLGGDVYHFTTGDDGSGKLYAGAEYWGGTAYTRVGAISAATWYMFTLTYNKATNNLSLYYNAGLEKSGSGTLQNYPKTNFTLGNRYAMDGYGMTGELDEISYYNRKMEPSEIEVLYNSGLGLPRPSSTDNIYPNFTAVFVNIPNNTQYSGDNLTIYKITINASNCNGSAFWYVNNVFYSYDYNANCKYQYNSLTKSAGLYNITLYAYGNGSSNNLNSTYIMYNIAKNSSYILMVNGNDIIQYGNPTSTNGSGCPVGLTCNFFRDNIIVSNPDTDVLSVNLYSYVYNSTGNINYSAVSASASINVTRISSTTYCYVNNTRQNIFIINGSWVYLNGSRIVGEYDVKLYLDGLMINDATNPSNYTSFPTIGLFNVTAIQEVSQNYSRSFETFFVNVSSVPVIPVFFSNTSFRVDYTNFSEVAYLNNGYCSTTLQGYQKISESGCSSYTGTHCNESIILGNYNLTLLYDGYGLAAYHPMSWAYDNYSCIFYGTELTDPTAKHIFFAWRVNGNNGQFCTFQNKWDYYDYQPNVTSMNLNLSTISSTDSPYFNLQYPCQNQTTPSSVGSPVAHPEWFIVDWAEPVYLVIIVLDFIIVLLLLFFRRYTWAGFLTLITGFIFLFSGILPLIACIVIAFGCLMLFVNKGSSLFVGGK